jgi:hypothetical protein
MWLVREDLPCRHAGAAQFGGNMPQLLQQLIDTSAIHRPRRAARHNDGAASPLQLEPALVGEQSIRKCHGVEVDPEVERQLTDWL